MGTIHIAQVYLEQFHQQVHGLTSLLMLSLILYCIAIWMKFTIWGRSMVRHLNYPYGLSILEAVRLVQEKHIISVFLVKLDPVNLSLQK